MPSAPDQRQQAASGLIQIAALVRAQSWSQDGTPVLAPTHAAVLRMLANAPAGLRAKIMAQRLGVSAASLSDSLKALQQRQWVDRHADPEDGRAVVVSATPAGLRIAAELQDPARGMSVLLEALDTGDLGALLRITQLLVHEAQRRGLATGLRTCLGCRHFRPFHAPQAAAPHFCNLVQQPLGEAELRVDCAEQQPSDPELAAGNARRFRMTFPHDAE